MLCSLFSFQSAFDTFPMTIVKVIVMTIGEIDYNTMLVDTLDAKNPDTGAYLVPYKESSFIFMCIFIFVMPIILTNLLVSGINRYECNLYREYRNCRVTESLLLLYGAKILGLKYLYAKNAGF